MNPHKFNYIYKITNKVNGKFYYGQHSTDNLDDGYMGSGIAITDAIEKYGAENFEKKILKFCKDRDELNIVEARLASPSFVRSSRDRCYNLMPGGNMRAGWELSDEHRKKISQTRIERIASGEIVCKGHRLTDEEKRNLSEKAKERLRNPENNPMYGRKHSEESVRKNRESHLGQVPWIKGKHHSENARQNISASRYKFLAEHPDAKLDWNSGKHWYTNGEDYVLALECPQGWWRGGRKGRQRTKEEIENQMRNTLRGENHPNWGKHLSDEHRKNISEAKRRNNKMKKGEMEHGV